MLTLRSVRCRNFKGLVELDLRVPAKGAILVSGPNEAGKTSLMEAVRYALTGMPPRVHDARELIRYGEQVASIVLECAATGVFFTIERELSRHGPGSVRLTLQDGTRNLVLQSETDVADALREITGFDAEGLDRAAFFDSPRFDPPRGPVNGGRPSAICTPRRDELEQARKRLLDVDGLQRSLDQARERLRLAQAVELLAGLETELAATERRLLLAQLRRAQIDYEAARAEHAAVKASLAELENSRSNFRHRLEFVERCSATVALVDALFASMEAALEVRSSLESVGAEIERARAAGLAAPAERDKAARLREARANLGGPLPVAAELGPDGAVVRELESLTARRLTLLEAQGAIEAEMAGFKDASERQTVASGPSSSVNAWRDLMATLPPILPFGGAAFAAAGIAGLALMAANGFSAVWAVLAFALTGVGAAMVGYCAYLFGARRERTGAGPEPTSLATGAGDPVPPTSDTGAPPLETTAAGDFFKVSEANLAGVIAQLSQVDRRLAEILAEGGGGASPDTGMLTDKSFDPDIGSIEAESREAERRAAEFETIAAALRRLEDEFRALVAEAERIDQNRDQRLARLRDLWPGKILPETLERAHLQALHEEAESGLTLDDAVVLGRELAAASARIAAVDPLVERSEQAVNAASENLRQNASRAGMEPEPAVLTVSLDWANPAALAFTGSDEAQFESELGRLGAEIGRVEREVAALESATSLGRAGIDSSLTRDEVRAIETSLDVRRHAAEIVAATQREFDRSAVPRALKAARSLLPALTGDSYFDLRLTVSGEIELWDEQSSGWAPVGRGSLGLRGQVDLALRLAASITALSPAGRGTPAFLFLDDPAAGADDARRSRIAAEIARGSVRSTFSQVIVLATTGQMDPRQFDHVVKIDGGRLAVAGHSEPAGRPRAEPATALSGER